MEQLNFKIDGEFITNIARDWFFEEKKDLKNQKKFCCHVLLTLIFQKKKKIIF